MLNQDGAAEVGGGKKEAGTAPKGSSGAVPETGLNLVISKISPMSIS